MNLQAVMSITSTVHGGKLLNLAKIYTNEAKYSGRNNTSMFEPENLWKNAWNSLSKSFQMNKTSRRDSFQRTK